MPYEKHDWTKGETITANLLNHAETSISGAMEKAESALQTLSVGTVTTGAAGSEASVNITGTAPTQTINFTIPQGIQGEKGDTGEGLTGTATAITTLDTSADLEATVAKVNEIISQLSARGITT